MSSDAHALSSETFADEIFQTEASPTRRYPTELGALGGSIALWAALCAVAATEAGRLVGGILSSGAQLLAMPLAFLGYGNLAAVILMVSLGLAALTGLSYIAAGLIKPHLRPLAVRGVHFIGLIAALMLCLRSLPGAA